MKNRILRTTLLVILMVIFAIISVLCEKTECNCDEEILTEWDDLMVSHSSTTWEYDTSSELNVTEEIIEEVTMSEELDTEEEVISIEELAIIMNDDIANISYNYNDHQQRMDWFKAYKEVIKEYPTELHSKTIYDTYNEEELDLLFRIVQAEAGSEYGFNEKANVVSVIFNRMNSGKSLVEVLTAKNQFEPYTTGRYKNVTVDEKTILACEFVYIFGDTTFGCIAFRSHKSCPERWYTWKDNYWEKQFGDAAHCFYK